MGYSRRLGPPIVSAAVATIAFTNFAIVELVGQSSTGDRDLFNRIWPISLTSGAAVILVMSFLYRALVELVQELERREQQARQEAVHDKLTGLANRTLLEDRLDQGIRRYEREGRPFALLMLDLDRFKQVNDTLGHAVGDQLVQQVGCRLNSLVRKTDTVARLGGDEFAIIQSAVGGKEEVQQLCTRILNTIAAPWHIGDKEVSVGVSVGAILVNKTLCDSSDLLRKADIAMYRAKASGRNCYTIFSTEMETAVQRRTLVEQHLRTALDDGEALTLHYQPQVDRCGKVIGLEGLFRWTDERLGQISPAEAIPIAEECGLINRIGETAMRLACRTAKDWPNLFFAVNLSPLQFRDPALATTLRDIARDEGVRPEQIELDDFGTGYSSLSFLRRYPIDKVKLDRSFIEAAHLDHSIAVIRAAVSLGHAMSLSVVAEGIATAAQEQIASEAGCDGFQGFLYSPAISADELGRFISQEGQLRAAA